LIVPLYRATDPAPYLFDGNQTRARRVH
jgi:hypothetical protein